MLRLLQSDRSVTARWFDTVRRRQLGLGHMSSQVHPHGLHHHHAHSVLADVSDVAI